MISLKGVRKAFGPKVAVDGLSIEVGRGELFAFLGPNGAGKTTTIKMMAGLLRPDAGHIEVAGIDVQRDYVAAKARLSFVPDEPYVYDKLSGREFLSFVGRMYGMSERAALDEAGMLIERFELGEFLDDLCESYSHGMKQRLVLSAALLHRPEVMLVDEPMVGLDPKSARLVKQILQTRASQGVTVFMSTHTLDVAEQLASRIGIINRGRMVADGTVDELRELADTDGGLEEAFLRITEAGSDLEVSLHKARPREQTGEPGTEAP